MLFKVYYKYGDDLIIVIHMLIVYKTIAEKEEQSFIFRYLVFRFSIRFPREV